MIAQLVESIEAHLLSDFSETTEYILLKHLEGAGYYDSPFFEMASLEENSEAQALILFRKHFILMHALHLLQERWYKAEFAILRITGTRIQCEVWDSTLHTNQSALSLDLGDQKLHAYYMDWPNFQKETNESVNNMLGDFWHTFSRYQKVGNKEAIQAFSVFDLDVNTDETSLKRAFRQRAQLAHPDRGGSAEAFISLQAAYKTALAFLKFQSG